MTTTLQHTLFRATFKDVEKTWVLVDSKAGLVIEERFDDGSVLDPTSYFPVPRVVTSHRSLEAAEASLAEAVATGYEQQWL